MDALALQGLFTPPVLALFGLCIGSFLNVVIHRWPLMLEREWRAESAELLGVAIEPAEPLTLSRPASRCPSCGHRIRWYENIPVLGWLRLRGRCSACKTPISPRYPLVEVFTGIVFAAIGWRFGETPLALLWAGIVAAALGWTLPLPEAVWGAVAGYLSLWSVYWLFKLLTGKEGMGFGDFKLLAALGAWLGLKMILPIVLIASLIGAVVGIAMKLRSSLREGRYVPFGPFLAGAGLTVLLAGPVRVLGWMGWA